MSSLRVLGLAAFASFATSNAAASLPTDEASVAVKRQSGFFEVTACHPHGDTLFCIYEGDEWEVTSDINVNDAPESFEGCHSHSGTELSVSPKVPLYLGGRETNMYKTLRRRQSDLRCESHPRE
jgi:hypothetical protein